MSRSLPTTTVGLVAMLLLYGTVSLLPHLHGAAAPSEAGTDACGDRSPRSGRVSAPDAGHAGRCLACSLHGSASTTMASAPVLPTPLSLDLRVEQQPHAVQRQPTRSLRSRGPPATA